MDWFLINSTLITNQPIIKLQYDSIFPYCNNDLILLWTLPNCLKTQLDFRIRVFASNLNIKNLTRLSNFIKNTDSIEDEWIYMEEFSANIINSTNGHLAIPCAQFDIIHEKFCFELISIDRKTSHYELWDRKCVFTEQGKFLI